MIAPLSQFEIIEIRKIVQLANNPYCIAMSILIATSHKFDIPTSGEPTYRSASLAVLQSGLLSNGANTH
ncbi:hypothetical protein CXR29_04180 [Brevibacterium linens]|nr:hypothetical protein CXR29_04180 [Brevibacterium linens]